MPNMCATIITSGCHEPPERDQSVSTPPSEEIPMMQRLYNRIWLLAAAAMLFFAVIYVGWGLMDILTVPVR
jgi:hypothetical protein